MKKTNNLTKKEKQRHAELIVLLAIAVKKLVDDTFSHHIKKTR